MEQAITIIKECGEHTILDRHTNFEPIIVAWKLDRSDMTWAQGHYFQDMEQATEWLAWKYDEDLPTKSKFKLHKTRTFGRGEDAVKYRWYYQVRTNEYGTWTRHVFTYDSTTPADGWWDWECDSEMEAQEWFDNYEV